MFSDSLPEGWSSEKLENVCATIYRYPSFYGMQKFTSGAPVIRGEHLLPDGISKDWSDYWYVSEDYAKQFPRTRLELHDVVMSVRGSVGTFARVGHDHVGAQISPNTIRLSPDPEKIAPEFFFYALKATGVAGFLSGSVSSSAVPALRATDIKFARVILPPLPEQRAIAGVFAALDNKIELNRRMNETLGALAQTLFQKMIEEGGGKQGWREDSLDSIATYLNGLALQKFPPDGDESLPVIKIAQLRAGNTEGADRASTKLPLEYIVEDGNVLFSWSGSLEVVLWCSGRGALNQHLFKVTSANYPKWFYYLWTRHHLPEFRAIAAGKATTMGHIQRHHLSEAKVLIPPAVELKAMDARISPLIEKIIANNVESRTLAALRDALLPKLLSGAVRVKGEAKPVQ